MLRDTSIVYDLCTQLKEYRYINHYSDEILTKSQEERINDYVDDLSIDLFFRLASFKPILITKNDIPKRFTPFGLTDIDNKYELNLNSKYDRHTFISVLTHPNFLKNKFKSNKFIMNLYFGAKRFSATGTSFLIKPGIFTHPYIDSFKKEHQLISLDYNRSGMLYTLSDFMNNLGKEMKYNIYPNDYFISLISDYARIKDQEIFPGITLEYALSLYVILVEKVKLKDDNISSIIAHGFYDSKFDITHPLQLFHNFELKLNRLFRKEDIEINDVFLRFVNPETSKAFKIEFDAPSKNFVKIQLFNNILVSDVWFYNTLPLPYLHNKIYK